MSRIVQILRPAGLLLAFSALPALAQDFSERPGAEAVEICDGSDSLFLAIDRERELLVAQRKELEEELDRMELIRESVRQETARLAALRDEVQGVMDALVASEEAEIQRLVTVYEGMKPEEAAALLDGLDMSITMVIFSAMSERRASPILARMNPVRAQAISRILVEMAKLPEDRNLEGIRLR